MRDVQAEAVAAVVPTNQGPYEACFIPVVYANATIPEPMYHIFGETRAQVENTDNPTSLGGFDRNALRTVEMVAHMLAAGAEVVVIQRLRPVVDS